MVADVHQIVPGQFVSDYWSDTIARRYVIILPPVYHCDNIVLPTTRRPNRLPLVHDSHPYSNSFVEYYDYYYSCCCCCDSYLDYSGRVWVYVLDTAIVFHHIVVVKYTFLPMYKPRRPSLFVAAPVATRPWRVLYSPFSVPYNCRRDKHRDCRNRFAMPVRTILVPGWYFEVSFLHKWRRLVVNESMSDRRSSHSDISFVPSYIAVASFVIWPRPNNYAHHLDLTYVIYVHNFVSPMTIVPSFHTSWLDGIRYKFDLSF